MSVKDLATELKLHWVTVYKYENGQRRPNLVAIDRIRKYTGGLVDIPDFLTKPSNMENNKQV
jgi:predicted transcriptional regulator